MRRDLQTLRSLTTTKRKETAMARTPIHPGEILADELEETGLSAKQLADVIDVPPNRLYQILAGKRAMTADTALRLSQYFGMAAEFWMNLQSAYELDLARQEHGTATSGFRGAARRSSLDQLPNCEPFGKAPKNLCNSPKNAEPKAATCKSYKRSGGAFRRDRGHRSSSLRARAA